MVVENLKKIFFVIIIVLLFGNYIKIVYAFNIDPSRAEVAVEPNSKVIKEYVITNTDKAPIKVKVSAEKWAVEEGRDATSWIKVLPKEVNIPANSSKKIKCEVTAPNGVEGEYTSSLVFKSISPAKKMEGFEELVAQLRVATYVVIKGTEKVSGEISKVEVLSTEPLKISIIVKNSGNIHIRPTGKVEVIKLAKAGTGVEENTVANLVLNPIQGPLFPHSEGEIGPKGDDVKLDPGNYKIRVKIEFNPEVILNKEIEFTVAEKK